MASTRKEPVSLDRPPKTPSNRSEVEKLRARAQKAASEARATVTLTLRIPVGLYKALVELAEEYHTPVSDIARQCLSDGTRKYRDFSTPRRDAFLSNPLAAARTLASAQPEYQPRRALDQMIARSRQARGPVLPPDSYAASDPPTPESAASAALQEVAEGLSTIPLAAMLPQGGTPRPYQSTPASDEDAALQEDLDALA